VKELDVEQTPQSRSTPAPPAASEHVHAGRACPTCGEPRQADARFCEECGFDYGTDAPPAAAPAVEERSRLSGPVLWLVLLFWAVLAVGGLYFLYTALYAL